MGEESFLLVSLKENKAKKLAEVIGNDTCRKILDFLAAKKSATETEISKQLSMPISTVHYNLRHLLENKLINADEFHYSEKGKEVNHYSLSNKLIIIAPQAESKFLDKLKGLLPVGLVTLAAAGIIQLMSRFRTGVYSTLDRTAYLSNNLALGGSQAIASAPMAKGVASEAAVQAAETTTTTLRTILVQQQSSLALWFLFGALFAIIMYIVWDWIRKR
jgi:DNA-binding transcriptional ArsR family regulator